MSNDPVSQFDDSVSDTNDGFIVGADPRQQPMTAAEVGQIETEVSASQQPLQVVEQMAPQQPSEQGKFFSEDDVLRIRQEEKDKLYSRLNNYETQLSELQAERDARLEEERIAREAAEAEQRRKEEETMEVRDLLQRREEEFNSRFAEMESRMEQERAIYEQEKQFNELQSYRQAALEQNAEYIMPELRDLVTGNSVEEIEISIDAMKTRTSAIMQSMQDAVQSQRQAMRGTTPTAPPVGPMEQEPALETMTPDQIRNMDPGTYAKYRARLLQAASQSYRAGG
jgi:DNA repair exonuclease SbcCD ATPase subunit